MWVLFNKLWVIALLLSSFPLKAALQFNIGDAITVFADKSEHITSQKKTRALGNVVIIHENETLYGQIATFNQMTGEVEIEGNVRYVGPEITMYGSKLHYNTVNQQLSLYEARIHHPLYTLIGKHITRVSPTFYTAEEAEYTTCQDCPESWSIYGSKVEITVGEYIKMRHTLIKVKGAVIMYLPYMVVPIKKDRQTGLLFPEFQFNFADGFYYEQPWFWAISHSADLTFSPASWGRRGLGGEIEARKVFGENRWVKIDSLLDQDKIYLPGKTTDDPSGTKYWRDFSRLEGHFELGHTLTHHLRMERTRDLDLFKDFRPFTESEMMGSEIGTQGFLDFRQDFFTLSTEASFMRNQLVNDPSIFDSSYVQILPRVALTSTPLPLVKTSLPMLHQLSVGLEGTYTQFRQDHFSEVSALRNVHRFTANPFLDWQFLNQGPINLKTRLTHEAQWYDFARDHVSNFHKSADLMRSELALQFDKIYGLAYTEEVPLPPDRRLQEKPQDITNKNILGNLPRFDQTLTRDTQEVTHYAFRHSQEIKLLHHYLLHQSMGGNNIFETQISTPGGSFDFWDLKRVDELQHGTNESRKIISPKNTLEFQWNHQLIKKSPNKVNPYVNQRYLRDNFNYNQVAFFNISQGLELRTENENMKDDLSRLFINTGFNLNSWSISAQEFYFHQSGQNITSISMDKAFSFFSLGSSYFLNSLTVPETENIVFRLGLTPWDSLHLQTNYFYDLTLEQLLTSQYGLIYSPSSHCWRIRFDYLKTAVDSRFKFGLEFNFSGSGFTSLGGQ